MSNVPSAGKTQHAGRRAAVADTNGERPGVDAADTGEIHRPQPVHEAALRPPVARFGDVLRGDEAQRARCGGLVVLGVGADIADMGEGEGDDLPGEGRVGHRLLIAGHARVEADLADAGATCGRMRAEAPAPPQTAISQNEHRCRSLGDIGVQSGVRLIRHDRAVLRASGGEQGCRQRWGGGACGHVAQGKAGRRDDGSPVFRRDDARLLPLAQRLGADMCETSSGFGSAEAHDDIIDG
jgi:hypothetical protein